MPWRIASRGERIADRLAVDDDAAGIERIGAEDRARHLGAAGADQSGNAEDLAVAHRQRDVVEHGGVRIRALPRRVRPSTASATSPGVPASRRANSAFDLRVRPSAG